MKRYLLAALLVLVPVTTAYAADLPDEQKVITDTSTWATTLTQGELFDDLDTWSGSPSQLQIGYDDYLKLGFRNSVLCTSTKDDNCKDALSIGVRAYLPRCVTASDQYCVEEFFAIKNGERINGVYKQQYPVQRLKGQFDAEPNLELPAGLAATLWQLPGITHAGGSDIFRVNAQLFGNLSRKQLTDPFGKFDAYQVWSSINAVTEIDFPGTRAGGASDLGGGQGVPMVTPSGQHCVVPDENKCLIAWPLDESISLGMTLRMAHPISGWLHGRFDRPDVKTETTKDGKFHITFLGTPMKVPTVYASIPWAEATSAFKKRFGDMPSGSVGEGGATASHYENAGRNQSSQQMVDDLNLWLPIIKDKASATPTYWMVRTTTNAETNKQFCLKPGFVNGVVTTNATAYTSGAPYFNEQYQSLDYKVASPHFDAKGNVNIGHYNLQINSEVARCLYGFTSAPISATVSVISSNGENQVATTTLKESNGWIYLTAAGFTYSSPTLRVKLTQEKEMTAQPIAVPQKISITCIKGKQTRKVTGVSPKCPAGYKKK
ncbi:MAG: hypothetical protein RL130_1527 [Actinomycetota bacterium]|jgi:hypothetical protein